MFTETTVIQTITREISADLETPISVYLKLCGDGPSFLLESVEGGERIARYSFIGVAPRSQYILHDGRVEIIENGNTRRIELEQGIDPLRFLQGELDKFRFVPQAGLPRFIGGLVGFLGYEMARYFEPTLAPKMPTTNYPGGIFLMSDTVVAFDHARRSLFLIANALDGNSQAAEDRLNEIEARIHQPLKSVEGRPSMQAETHSNMSQDKFESMVRDAKEHIAAGDIFQVVLSQRFSRETSVEPVEGNSEPGLAIRENLVDDGESPFESAMREEIRRHVEDELRKIAEPYRSTVILRDLEEMSYEEIAEITEVSLGTVKSRLTRGREALKQRLSAYVQQVAPELGLRAPNKKPPEAARVLAPKPAVEVNP